MAQDWPLLQEEPLSYPCPPGLSLYSPVSDQNPPYDYWNRQAAEYSAGPFPYALWQSASRQETHFPVLPNIKRQIHKTVHNGNSLPYSIPGPDIMSGRIVPSGQNPGCMEASLSGGFIACKPPVGYRRVKPQKTHIMIQFYKFLKGSVQALLYPSAALRNSFSLNA